MHAIPLNALIKNTRLRRRICTSRVGRARSLMECHCLMRSPRQPRDWIRRGQGLTTCGSALKRANLARKHDLNSLVLRRPQMSTRKRRNRSLGVYGLHCDVAMRDQCNSSTDLADRARHARIPRNEYHYQVFMLAEEGHAEVVRKEFGGDPMHP